MGGNKRPNNMFIHQFDFKRWFHMDVWHMLHGKEQYDMEVINLVASYLSTQSKNADKLYLPFFFEKYNMVSRDNYLEKDLVDEALPKFYGYIAKTLEKIKRLP